MMKAEVEVGVIAVVIQVMVMHSVEEEEVMMVPVAVMGVIAVVIQVTVTFGSVLRVEVPAVVVRKAMEVPAVVVGVRMLLVEARQVMMVPAEVVEVRMKYSVGAWEGMMAAVEVKEGLIMVVGAQIETEKDWQVLGMKWTISELKWKVYENGDSNLDPPRVVEIGKKERGKEKERIERKKEGQGQGKE